MEVRVGFALTMADDKTGPEEKELEEFEELPLNSVIFGLDGVRGSERSRNTSSL